MQETKMSVKINLKQILLNRTKPIGLKGKNYKRLLNI